LLTLLMEPQGSASTPLQDSIKIDISPRNKTISIRDFGIGMTKEGLEHAVTIGWPKTNDLSGGQCTKKARICIVKLQCPLIICHDS
jgi:HSP90 family molecular chaperone